MITDSNRIAMFIYTRIQELKDWQKEASTMEFSCLEATIQDLELIMEFIWEL